MSCTRDIRGLAFEASNITIFFSLNLFVLLCTQEGMGPAAKISDLENTWACLRNESDDNVRVDTESVFICFNLFLVF